MTGSNFNRDKESEILDSSKQARDLVDSTGRDAIGLGLLPDWLTRSGPPKQIPQRRANGVLRAGVYGRISTLHQRETSIDRQVVEGEDYAVKIGGIVVARWIDFGKSGAFWHGRDGIEDAVQAARAGEIDILVLEHVDRLGRDLGIIGTVYRELTDLGVEIHGTKKGRKLDHADVAMLGLAAVEARLILLERTRDGKRRMVGEKRSPNGKCFGYDSVPGKPGCLVINEAQASVIRDIFNLRLDGVSFRHIAFALNRRGIKTLLGKDWCALAVKRVVSNERYAGDLVWGRTLNKKSFWTGKIVTKPGPDAELLSNHVSDWIIVDRATFDAAQIQRDPEAQKAEKAPRVIPKYLLSSKIRCHSCGLSYIIRGVENGIPKVTCSGYNKKGACPNDRILPMDKIEQAVLDILKAHLNDPDLEAEYAVAYEAKLAVRVDQLKADRSAQTVRRETLLRQIRDTFDAEKTKGLSESALVATRQEYSEDLEQIEEALAAMPTITRSGPPAPERLRTLRDAFDQSFSAPLFRPTDEAGFRVLATFRAMITSVTIEPDPCGRGFRVIVRSHLKSLLQKSACSPDDIEEPLAITSTWRPFRVRGRLPNGVYADMTRAAEAGLARLTDAQWEQVRPIVPASVMNPRGGPAKRLIPDGGARQVVEATIFAFMTGAPWKYLPLCFGERRTTLAAIKRLIYAGGWQKIVEVLEVHGPELLENIDPQCTNSLRQLGWRTAGSVPASDKRLLSRGKSAG